MGNENLKERVYSIHASDSESIMKEQLYSFFGEVVQRRTANSEGGLQAAFVLLQDGFAAKVCERNGIGTHAQSQINLVKFLKGKQDFLSEREMMKYRLYEEEERELVANGVEGRIVSGENYLTFPIIGRLVNLNDFQRSVLQEIIQICEEIRDKNIYQDIELGIYIKSEDINIECESLTEEKLHELKSSLGMSFGQR